MIAITFTAPLVDNNDYVSVEGNGQTFFKNWLKAYNPKTCTIFLDDDWSFHFMENNVHDVYVFTKKHNGDVMILAKKVKTIDEYKYVGAAGIEPAGSRM